MHTVYLLETFDKPEPVADCGIIDNILEQYYYECEHPDLAFDWYEVGGRWDGEIPGNCCLGADLPEDFEPFGLIAEEGSYVIDKEWNNDNSFWDEYSDASHEERLAEMDRRSEEAVARFHEDYRIYPDRWYTVIDFHL